MWLYRYNTHTHTHANLRAKVEFFTRVPEKVKKLQRQLEHQPELLKVVYLESVRLEALRDGLYVELERQEAAGDAHAAKLKVVLDQQLSVVPQLSRQIQSVLWNNIARLFDIAAQAPDLVVETFEVIEMQEEYVTRRFKQAGAQGKLDSITSISNPVGAGLKSLRPAALERLVDYMTERVESR